MPLGMVRAPQAFGPDVEYVQSGKNAVDLHAAYYTGRLAAGNSNGSCRLIFKDTGVDALREHLNKQKISLHDIFFACCSRQSRKSGRVIPHRPTIMRVDLTNIR